MPLNAPIKDRVISSRHLTSQAKFKGSNLSVVSNIPDTETNPANISREYIAAIAITMTNITLSGPQTHDGVSITAGMTVLVNGQTDKTQNGPYICQTGAWTRVDDIALISGFIVVVRQGTTYANTQWIESLEFDFFTPGTTQLEWVQTPASSAALVTSVADTPTIDLTVASGVLSGVVQNNSIDTVHLKDNAVTTAKILDGNITTAKVADNAITTNKIVDNAVTSAKIINDAVTTAKILNNNVTTAKIADGAVTDVKLASNSVTTVKILDSNVTTAKIANLAVTSGKIANSAVTATQLANNAVTTAKILDANVTTAKLADGAVTTLKIADANVTTAKLADGAVTNAKLGDASVSTAKLQDGSVTTPKIAALAVTTVNIADSAVTSPKIANGAVGTPKIADDAVTWEKAAASSIGAKQLIVASPSGTVAFASGAGTPPALNIDVVQNFFQHGLMLINLNTGGVTAGATKTFRVPATGFLPIGYYDVKVYGAIACIQSGMPPRVVRHTTAPTLTANGIEIDRGATHADPGTGVHQFLNNCLKGNCLIDMTSTTEADRTFNVVFNLGVSDSNGTADSASVIGFCHLTQIKPHVML